MSLVNNKIQSLALFFNLVGVINIDHSYAHSFYKSEFIDGIFDTVCVAHVNNFKIAESNKYSDIIT